MACSNYFSKHDYQAAAAYLSMTLFQSMSPYLISDNIGKAQAFGKFHEWVSLVHHPGATDLNEIKSNFSVYDQINFEYIASTKTHEVEQEHLSSRGRSHYTDEFRSMMGLNEPEKFSKSAEELFNKRDMCAVPSQIQQAETVEQVKFYLASQSVMQVPSYHVSQVQDALANSIQRHPNLYGLSPDDICQEVINAFTSRVVPIDDEIKGKSLLSETARIMGVI